MNLYKNENDMITVKESTKGSELKELYSKFKNIDLKANKLRFIFAGALIKDEDMLYQHKISSGFVIQVVINPIEPEQTQEK